MPDAERLKQEAREAVDAMADEVLRLSRGVHAKPELAFEEREAAALLSGALRAAGLDVEAPAYGLETAFATEFGGEGPCVAVLAEYDALPGIGHACGHNLIAAAGVGAGLALAALRDRLPGRVRVLGTPAEERGAGKEIMAREGALEGVDAALMIHPAGLNLETMPCIAVADVTVRYHGTAAHAAAMPHLGVNALDALLVAYQSIAALRQHIQQTERIHGIVLEGGDAPNIVPERAVGRFYVRARNAAELVPLKRRVEGCFRAGAEATGARLEIDWAPIDYEELRRNGPLETAFRRNAESLGREFFPFDKIPPGFAGSTDMGNVSQRVPSIHPMLAASPPHVTIHNAEFEKYAGSDQGEAAALDGARALAMTVLDVLCDAALRARARSVFDANGVDHT